jgi:hypothetical protein
MFDGGCVRADSREIYYILKNVRFLFGKLSEFDRKGEVLVNSALQHAENLALGALSGTMLETSRAGNIQRGSFVKTF